MPTWKDRFIVSALRQEEMVVSNDYRWIEIFVVSISRNSADIDDIFDESSSYSRTVVKHRLQAKVHRLSGWERQRMITSGLVVEEGDVIVSGIPAEYKSQLAVDCQIAVYTPDLSSMNNAKITSVFPADEMESSWIALARRIT
jgi:hypothetical protein